MHEHKISTKEKPVHVIALSGGAANALKYILNDADAEKISYVNTTNRPHYPEHVNYVPIQLQAGGTNRNQQYAHNEDRLQEVPWHIRRLFAGDEHFIVLVSLGGVQGTLLAKRIYWQLVDEEKSFTMIVSMPFHFEGPYNTKRAKEVLRYFLFDPRVELFKLDDLRRRYGNSKLSVAFRNADLEFYYHFKEQILTM